MNESPGWTILVNAVSWFITFLVGCVVALLKIEAARQEKRLSNIENNYKVLNDKVLGEYPSKADLNNMLHELKERLQIMDTKIDSLILRNMEK